MRLTRADETLERWFTNVNTPEDLAEAELGRRGEMWLLGASTGKSSETCGERAAA